MSWFDAESGVLVGDAPSDALSRALGKVVDARGRWTMGEMVDALAWALRHEGPEHLEGGDVLRLLWIRVRRDEKLFTFGADGSAEGGALAEVLAQFIRSADTAYQKALHRKPWWAEVVTTLDMLTRMGRNDFVLDPRRWDLGEAWVGWADARGSVDPQDTVEALAEVVRARWAELVWGGIALEQVGLRLSTGEALVARGRPVDPALVAEVAAIVRAVFERKKQMPTETHRVEHILSRALTRRRERFLGGAECERCSVDLDVKDGRRRVYHPTFHLGFVVREVRDGGEPKLEVGFSAIASDHVDFKTVLESTVTEAAPVPRSERWALPASVVPVPYARPLVVVSNQVIPRALAVDATDVYWTDPDDDRIMRAPKRGGRAVVLAIRLGWADQLLLDERHLYWAGDEQVRRMPKNGGEIETIAVCKNPVRAIATDGALVYVADRLSGEVIAVPREGGDAVSIAEGQRGIDGLAVDDDAVYWTTSEGALRYAPKDGEGPVVTRAVSEVPAGALVVDETHVYWLVGTSASTAIVCVPKEVGKPRVLAHGLRTSSFLVQDADHLYWVDPRAGAIMRVAKAGGAPAAMVEGLDAPEAIAVDVAHVYWAETGDRAMGTILRFPVR